MKDHKLVCLECDWVGMESTVLSAPSPFNGDALNACPRCRDMNLRICCDEPACKQPATCGDPTPEGYRNSCGKHQQKS